jgi:hypothetical protein
LGDYDRDNRTAIRNRRSAGEQAGFVEPGHQGLGWNRPRSHAEGEIAFSNAPSAGGNVGWICTAAGTPGTWKKFGAIQGTNAYTPTNVSTDRSYDANATTTDELADVLGTLIADLQAAGVLA